MTENKTMTPLAVESIPSRNEGVSALASANAPVIYFDLASAWVLKDGVVAITLEMSRYMTAPTGPAQDFAVSAHLRMGLEAARGLRQALEDVEKYATEAIKVRDAEIRARDEAAKVDEPPAALN